MSTTNTRLAVERLAATPLIEDLRVLYARSCRIVARLRLAAGEDLTVMELARSLGPGEREIWSRLTRARAIAAMSHHDGLGVRASLHFSADRTPADPQAPNHDLNAIITSC